MLNSVSIKYKVKHLNDCPITPNFLLIWHNVLHENNQLSYAMRAHLYLKGCQNDYFHINIKETEKCIDTYDTVLTVLITML
jgi:hypothetical protein